MDRNLGKEKMDQANSYEQVRYNASDPRTDGLGSINQRFSHDPSTIINANVRPPDYVISAPPRPILNYSIQTGEEFSFEFMRDRVVPKQQFIPNTYPNPSGLPVYVDIKGLMGMPHPVAESGSNTSSVHNNASEKNHAIEHEKKTPAVVEERIYQEPVQSGPVISSRNDNNQRFVGIGSSRASEGSLNQPKFLCSFGGKILPRPRDRKLRYVGGETRIIRISKDISYEELMLKMSEIYPETRAVKYQLPGEDLDALVSVSCDEDLQNMMEECNVGSSQKPRMFLFSSNDIEEAQFGMAAPEGDSEVQYVVAVNGMDLSSRKSSMGTPRASGNNLDELLSINAEREMNRVASEPIVASVPSDVQVSQPPYLGQAQVYPGSIYTPYAMNCVTPLEPPAPSHPQQTQQGAVREEQPESSIKEAKMKRDGSFQKVNETARVSASDDYNNNNSGKEANMKRESSTPRMSEYGVSSVSSDCIVPKEETPSVMHAASDTTSSYMMPEISYRKSQDRVQESDVRKVNHDDQSSSQLGGFSTGDSSNISNLEQPVIHQRVFHSERIMRDQAETNRLSKSNDSLASQFLMAQTASDPFQPISESVDKIHEASMASETAKDSESKMNSSVSKDAPESTPEPQPQQLGRPMDEPGTSKIEERSMNQSEAAFLNQLTRAESSYVDQSQVTTPKLTELGWNNMGENNNWDHVSQEQVVSSETSSANAAPRGQLGVTSASPPEKGDIVVDINDRFPRDFLADIFLKAKEESPNLSGLGPLHVDGAGMSLNVQNHEPKNWSYFRNLAQDEFVRNDVSLMDQDHPGFPTSMSNTGEAPVDYSYPPLQQPEKAASGQGRFDTVVEAHQDDYIQPQVKSNESIDKTANTGVPLIDLVAPDANIKSLQIIKNDDLETIKELGSGTFGTVYHGKWRGTDVAIKRIKKSCFIGRSSEQEKLTAEFWHEADILSKLHHPNVVAFYGVVKDGPGGTLATVAEFMVNGSLRHVLLSNRHLDRRKRLIIAMDAAFGMEYLHSKNIVHFDLKCDNLLVNLKDPARPICKVADFGLSKIKRNTLVTGGVRGTLPWMAPELLSGSSSKVSEKVDVFSFGIVLWEILTGEEPYANMHYGAIIGGIVNNTLRPGVPSHCDPEWRILMEQCWAPDPLARPCFTEIARRLRVMSSSASHSKPHPHHHLPK